MRTLAGKSNLFFGGCFFKGNTGFIACAFGVNIAVNQFDDCHWCHVAIPEAGF